MSLWVVTLAFKITSFYSHSHLIIWVEYHIEIESLRLLLQDS